MQAGLPDPVPVPLARALREAVVEHVSTERRRVHPSVLRAGRAGDELRFEDAAGRLDHDHGLDHAQRVDVVAALLTAHHRERGVPAPLLWLTRVVADDERAARLELPWLAAVLGARAELDEAPPFVVVDRRGWRDPATGTARTWVRLRPRRSTPPPVSPGLDTSSPSGSSGSTT